MVFPRQELTVRDPGLGVTEPAADIPIISGISTGGSALVNVRTSIQDPADIRTLLGYGPLAEDVALALSQRGGPVYAIRHNSADNKALAAVALTPPGVGTPPAITITGTPYDRFQLRLEIVLGGTRGVATYRYSLDDFDNDVAPRTWSQVRVTPSGGTFVMAGTGLTLNFPAGTYVAADVYTMTLLPQEPLPLDLAAVAAILVAQPALDFNLWMVSGAQPSSTAGSALASALAAHLTTLTNSFRYVRGICDVGSDDVKTDIETEAAAWTSKRISPAYGFTLRTSLLPFEGFATRKTSMVSGLGVRAMRELISSDISRVASGPDEGVSKIFFDGFYDQSLDTVQISTMRTWPGMPGFYFTGAKLKCEFGSDFTDLQYGRVMDVACRTTYLAQVPYQSESLRTIPASQAAAGRPAGAIDERDAKAIESDVQSALNDNLMTPDNARGVPGHVSSVKYTVDLSVNLVQTSQLKTTVAILPLGYAKIITTTLFFSLTA